MNITIDKLNTDKIFDTEEAQSLIDTFENEGDDWKYKLANLGHGKCFINVYDETGYFLGNM